MENFQYPVDHPEPFRARPQDIDVERETFTRIGSADIVEAARVVIVLCTRVGSWQVPRIDFLRECPQHIFDRLLSHGVIKEADCETFAVTDEFVRRCFDASPTL